MSGVQHPGDATLIVAKGGLDAGRTRTSIRPPFVTATSNAELPVSDRLQHGRLSATVSEILDLGPEVLPHFEMAAVPTLDGNERPGEEPRVRRQLRAEGVRASQHRGVLLLEPGDLERLAGSGILSGSDEVFFLAEWNDEFEPFPGRVSADLHDFNESTPLGLEEWMVDSGCLLAIGDGRGVNVATTSRPLLDRIRGAFKAAKG